MVPNATRASVGYETLYATAGFVIAWRYGSESAVPKNAARPTCHHTRGAIVYRFHRATPRGTAYSAAETAAVVQNANVFSPVIATGTRGNARPEEVLFASSSEALPPDGSEPPSPWVAGAGEAAEAAEARTRDRRASSAARRRARPAALAG